MTKRLTLVLFLLLSLIVPVSSHAGVLRTLGHAGEKIGKGTVSYLRDIGRDTLKWIF